MKREGIRNMWLASWGIVVFSFAALLTPAAIIWAHSDHYYGQAYKTGTFYGVWAKIYTANPKLREPVFSYASVNISDAGGRWVETGWTKQQDQGCIPKFTWAIQPGNENVIASPSPSVGTIYQYLIFRNSPGSWQLQIATTGGTVLVNMTISNPSMTVGSNVQALGEVQSVNHINDMGISQLTNLLWRDSSSVWHGWDGWSKVEDNPPYHVEGIVPDGNNNVQVRGMNGSPVPTGAPCP